MLIWYRNSFLASVVSIIGSGAAIMAVTMLFSGEILTGIVFGAIAAGLLYLGKKISEQKSFDKWWKQVEKANLEPEIRRSREMAVEIYKKNPEPRTLEKIRNLNPDAARYIQNGFKEPVSMVTPKPQATRTAPPVQQQTYQPPVQQPVVMRKQEPISVHENKPVQNHDISVQMDHIMAEVTENAKSGGDLSVYWNCIQRMETLYSTNRENTEVRGHLSALYFLYASNAFSFAQESAQKRTQVFNAVQRSINLSDGIKPDDMDYYAYMLLRHAVETVLEATYDKDRNKMLNAYQRLDLVANYRIVGVDETMRRMMVYNDAVNYARAWLCFWMAHSYAQQESKNFKLAKMYIDESLRYCPVTPVRNCDLNPRNNDQAITMNRVDILKMRDIIYVQYNKYYG